LEQLGALKEDNPENRILKLKRGRTEAAELTSIISKDFVSPTSRGSRCVPTVKK